MDPAAISARPAVTMMLVLSTAPDNPAASAKGTVRPSDIPITRSRTTSLDVKCRSICGVCGIEGSFKRTGASPRNSDFAKHFPQRSEQFLGGIWLRQESFYRPVHFTQLDVLGKPAAGDDLY